RARARGARVRTARRDRRDRRRARLGARARERSRGACRAAEDRRARDRADERRARALARRAHAPGRGRRRPRRGRAALLRPALRAHPGAAHLVADDADPVSLARADALHTTFVEAGWHVDAVERVTYRLRPGWFVIAADNPWPPEVDAVRAAFDAAGLTADFASGYRAYLATKPAEPHVELAPDRS